MGVNNMDYIQLIETTGLDLAITLQFTNEEIMMLARGRTILSPQEKQVPAFLKNHIVGITGDDGNLIKIALCSEGNFIKWISEDYMRILAHGYPVTYVSNTTVR